jgi:branched-chain amino acid transport system permease protein
MVFFVALLVHGLLTGALYALLALAFVVVYKASRLINFALGECAMFTASLATRGTGPGLRATHTLCPPRARTCPACPRGRAWWKGVA